MRDKQLEPEGFAFYVRELEQGSSSAYFAYRIYEKSWMVPRKAQHLLRAATIHLIEADPWFLATAMPYFLTALQIKDLERLTPFVGAGQPRRAASMLRATLWYHGRKGPHRPDRAGLEQLRRALGYLRQVPKRDRTQAWHEMAVGCYRVLDYEKYKRAFGPLHALTAPEWRALGLSSFLDVLASKEDWKTYDRYRREWDRLPPDHHACECYLNTLHTNDGLRAAASGQWTEVAAALTRSATVRGCPHLNSGGLRLDLVRLLVAKKQQLDTAHEYLKRAEGYEGRDQKAIRSLRAKLKPLARSA